MGCGDVGIHPAPLSLASLQGLMKAKSLSSCSQMLSLSVGSAALLGLRKAQKPTSAEGSMTDTTQLTAAAHTHTKPCTHTVTHTHTLLNP